jgi:voltage-gated potassium channel
MLSFVFLYDFLRNLITSKNRLNYLKWGWLDLLSSLPWIPFLRILRISSIIRGRRYLMETTGKSLIKSLGEKRGESALLTTVIAIFILVLFASVLILNFEADAPNGNIEDANDAIWWVWVTMTTVGYGDRVPVTESGRLVGFILMTAGIAMIGVLTGYLANAFSPKSTRTDKQLTEIEQQLAEIKRLLKDQQNIVGIREDDISSDD